MVTSGLSVAVLGANGVYGRHLIPRLVAAGHRVVALARRPSEARVAAAFGAEVREADIYRHDQLATALRGSDVGVNLATSVPGPSGRGDYEANDRLRRDGTPIWVAACRDAGVPRVLQQSISFLNIESGDEWIDEDTPAPPGDTAAGTAIAAALAMEDAIRGSGLDWTILRGGLFYGPGTGNDDQWYDRAGTGELRLPGDGSAYVSLVHIEDMAAATVLAIGRWPSGQTLIVSDDQPARWRDVLSFVTRCAGTAPPTPGGRLGLPSFRVRNGRARDVLSWAPFYSTYHSGLIR